MYRDIKISWSQALFLAVLLGLILMPVMPLAQTTAVCGNFIDPANYWYVGFATNTSPIANCDNPFEKTNDLTGFLVNNQPVVDGGTYIIDEAGATDYGFADENYFTSTQGDYFKHSGQDYVRVNTDFAEPTQEEINAKISEFFNGNQNQINSYSMIYWASYRWPYFYDGGYLVDAQMGERIQIIFDRMVAYIESTIKTTRQPLPPGTYTVVSIDTNEGPVMNYNNNFLESLFALMVHTAHAYYYVNTITFTLATAPPEPTGASSVLFLPGIMGSRLYEESDACFGSGEQERWFSMGNCDQLRLLTKVDGTSVNDIYIKNVDSTVIEETIGFNLYKEFIKQMDELEKEKVVADFIPFAYDWRLRLDDILKTKLDLNTNEVRYDVSTPLTESHLYKTVAEMVKNSYSGKVTIVAHSNGGLVAKAFLSSLQSTNDPLLKKIDNLILVASPQVGTPDSVVSMLHGSEIGGGFVVSQEMVRKLLNTAPFGYHLLPNKNYFTGTGVEVKTPVIVINDGLITNSWIEQFGGNIDSTEELYTFLSRDSGRVKPAEDDLLLPETVDNYLLNYANTVADIVNNWVPSDDIKVYQIAGTGVETPTGITYFTDKECIRGGKLWFECAEYKPKLGYYINFTFDGDQTVVVPSALAMAESDNVERWWLDLFEFADDTGGINVHKNILEVPAVINFTKNIIQSTTSLSTRYLSDTIVTPEIGKRLSFFLHSPLDMYIKSKEGMTSSSTNEIPGAIYKRYGEVQYISLPAGTSGVILYLRGSQEGSFTLVVEEWDGNIKTNTYDFQAIPSGTSTLASLSLNDFSQNSELRIDFDNNGVIDGVVSAATDTIEISDIVSEEKEVVVTDKNTYTSKRSRIRKNIPPGQVAGIAIINTEEWYYGEMFRLLKELSRVLSLLEKIGYEK